MNESDFEGTVVLERLAEIDKMDEFYQAVDADDFDLARSLMETAQLDSETISIVLKKMGISETE